MQDNTENRPLCSRQVRMKASDILGTHAGGPHMNFDSLSPKYKSVHVFFID